MESSDFQKLCMIQAPAKAILCGQHAVVYGQDAIAIAIGLYCQGLCTARSKAKDDACLAISLDIEHDEIVIQTEGLRLFRELFEMRKYASQFQQFDRMFVESTKEGKNKPIHARSLHFKLGLFLAKTNINWAQWIKQSQFDYHLKITSTIPVGKCLGSSAAFNTVLSTAFLIIFQPNIVSPSHIISAELQNTVNQLSVSFESVEHGNPSGIDNFVSVHGGMILFNKSKEPKFKRLDSAAEAFKNTFDVAIADSQIPKNTKLAVDMVRQRCQANSEDQDKIKQIGKISAQMLSILQGKEIQTERVLFLIGKNHELLKQFDLSHLQLERLKKTGEQLGWSSKITGSGMGGCLLLLAESNKASTNQEIHLAQLDEEGLRIHFYQAK